MSYLDDKKLTENVIGPFINRAISAPAPTASACQSETLGLGYGAGRELKLGAAGSMRVKLIWLCAMEGCTLACEAIPQTSMR